MILTIKEQRSPNHNSLFTHKITISWKTDESDVSNYVKGVYLCCIVELWKDITFVVCFSYDIF